MDFLGRHETAELLGLSTRTLDRYVKNKKISVMRKKGRILFRTNDVESFRNIRDAHNPHVVTKASLTRHEEDDAHGKYKILFENAKSEIEKKDALLMNLHQKLGFLKSELKNSVPLLESRTTQKDLQGIIGAQENEISNLRTKVFQLKIIKILSVISFLLILTAGVFLFLIQQNP